MHSNYMYWTQELSVGNNDIDNDHRKLISIINDIIDLTKFKKNRKECARILSEMTDYSIRHLDREEIYMKKMRCENFNEHKLEHDKYRYKVAMYNVDFTEKNNPIPEEIIQYLKNWWKDHILKYDVGYEKYKNAKGLNIKY